MFYEWQRRTCEDGHYWRRGVTQLPGIYFLGLRWLYKRKSAFLLRGGPAEDAAYLAEQILARS